MLRNPYLPYTNRYRTLKITIMKIQKTILILVTAILFLGFSSCKKDDFENSKTLKRLYKSYENGEITECKYNSEVVYSVDINAIHDGGTAIFDYDGNQIGTCNYATGIPDAICEKLTDCETIYRIENNRWGKPAVDKYGLGK